MPTLRTTFNSVAAAPRNVSYVQKIRDIFRAEIAAFAALPGAMGYDVTLRPPPGSLAVSLDRALPQQSAKHLRRNPVLAELVHEGGGVLILRNAFIGGEASLRLSRSCRNGTLLADLFHRDSTEDGNVTIIANTYPMPERRAPTIYARHETVLRALQNLDLQQYPEEAREDIRAMIARADRDYGLDLAADSVFLRHRMLDNAPLLTNDIVARIPESEMVRMKWQAGMLACVFHANDRSLGILHARPACGDTGNPLKGYLLIP